MNAIITLCHFCERHGPRILYCTRPFHPNEVEQDTCEGIDNETFSPSISQTSSQVSSGEYQGASAFSLRNDLCEGCSSVQSGFVSHDDESKVKYVSTQHPRSYIFSLVRQACIRSLSSEVCPGREGPIFFGDEHQGQVLSYTFHIEDSQARGFQRLYSILVIMMDKVYLLNSWPFLVPNIKTIVEYLQTKAHVVYEDEQKKCPQRAYRLSSSTNPAKFIHQRGANNPGRSIIELVNDKNIFRTLHMSFVWILKVCGSRITESLLEGPPTEDSVIDMEKQEETEEGFIKLFKQETEAEGLDEVQELLSDNEEVELEASNNIKRLMKVLGYNDFHKLAHHTVLGNQIIAISEDKFLLRYFFSVLKQLLPKGCCRLIPHSTVYEESWKCNFLGLAHEVTIPPHVISNERFILVDILKKTSDGAVTSSQSPVACSNFCIDFSHYAFQLRSPLILPEQAPSILYKMEEILQNDNLNDRVTRQFLSCVKEELMNKVKVLFKFTKAGGNRSEEDTAKLLNVVGAKDEDKELLKFWMTGLSVQYRTHILSASRIQQNVQE